jgi:gluconolactonase
MAWKFELVAGPYGTTVEGPAWDGRYIYFTIVRHSVIMRYDPLTGDAIEWSKDSCYSNGLCFDSRGTLFGCAAGGRAIVQFDSAGKPTVVADGVERKKLNTPNDLAIDYNGRIWFSDPWNSPLALAGDSPGSTDRAVLRADPKEDGTYSVQRVISDLTAPNGVLLSRDQKTLYVSEQSYDPKGLRELRAYPILEDGVGRHTVLHQFGADFRGIHRAIDGMCLDSDGNIVATAGWEQSGPGPLIYVFSPRGRVIETHPVPGNKPSNCTFGDADMRSLYVTTGLGHLFRVRTDRQGWSIYPFGGEDGWAHSKE